VIRHAAWPILAAAVVGVGIGCRHETDADTPSATAPSSPPSTAPSAAASADAPADAPWFEPLTDQGVDFVHRSGEQGEHRIMASLCGGVALFDADGDGHLDLYLVQAGDLDDPTAREPNRLYLNDGTGRFRDITESSGTGDRGYGMGVACGDFDGDGLVDLYVTNMGPNVLYRNLGGGIFEDVTASAGVGDPGFSTGAAFLDADGDGDLDLWVINYIDWQEAFNRRTCFNQLGTADYCVPTAYGAPSTDRLYRNDGDGTFTDISVAAGIASRSGTGLGIVVADFDGDDRPDVFIANDAMKDHLWLNRGDGRFEDVGLLWGVATNGQGLTTASMGVAARDFDADGDPDLIVGNLAKEPDSLFRNDGGGFSDVTNLTRLGPISRPFTRFGLGWYDFDHDGFLDLYEANGRVMRQDRSVDEADPYAEPNLVIRGTPDGRFAEVLPRGGTAAPLVATSRGAAFGDFDGDGAIDVVVVNRDGPVHLLRNIAPRAGGSLLLDLREADGRPARHARVLATVGERSVRIDPDPAGSYFASNDPRAHLGLGEADVARDVTVRWADGTQESFGDLPAGPPRRLVRGTGTPAD
jgi:hypothetical protein